VQYTGLGELPQIRASRRPVAGSPHKAISFVDVAAQLEQRAAASAEPSESASQSGLDSGLPNKMLPILAMLVAGCMAKQRGASTASGWGDSQSLIDAREPTADAGTTGLSRRVYAH
jgi:hypothetical protein